jgi:threonine dehydrogenase-like Zn-dependent dehydrogenase
MMHNGLMRGSVLTRTGHIEIDNLAIPEPGPDEVRIHLRQAGICGSDIHIFAGHFANITHPLTMGHEGLGIIEKCGANVPSEMLGQRVVIEPNFPCQQCRYCKRGKGNVCPNKRIFGVRETGCFAEYAVVPAEFVWQVPEGISDDDAVMIEPLAVAFHALRTSSAKPGDTIAVIGMGPIGLLLTRVALALGYRALVNDKILFKVELPVSWGASSPTIDAQKPVVDQLKSQFAEADVVAVFETAGSKKGTLLAIESAPRGAEIVLVGLSTEEVPVIPASLTRNGNQVFTSMIYDHPEDFRQVIDLVAGGTIAPSCIISSRTSLENLPEALGKLVEQNTETKVVVDFAQAG